MNDKTQQELLEQEAANRAAFKPIEFPENEGFKPIDFSGGTTLDMEYQPDGPSPFIGDLVGTPNAARDKQNRGQDTVISGGQPRTEFDEPLDPNALSNRSLQAQQKKSYDAIVSKDNPLEAAATAQEEVARLKELNEATSNPEDILTPFRQKALGIIGDNKATAEQVDKVAVSIFTRDLLSKAADEASMGWDMKTAGNLLDLLVPDQRNDLGDVAEAIGLHSEEIVPGELAETYFNSIGLISRIRGGIAKMEPKDQAQAIQYIADTVYTETGNEMKRAALLRNLLEASPEELSFEYDYLPAVEVLAVTKAGDVLLEPLMKAGSAMFTGIKNLFGRTNPVKTAAENGNVEAAATATDEIIKGNVKSSDVSLDATEAAAGVDPMADTLNDLEVLHGAPKGVSDRIREELDVIDELVKDAQENKTELLPLTPEEKKAAVRNDIARRTDIEKVSDVRWVSDDGASAVVEFDVKDSAGNVTTEKLSHTFVLDDVTGSFVEKEVTTVSQLGRKIVSPNLAQGKDRDILVEKGVTAMAEGARTQKILEKAQITAVKAADDVKKVNQLLTKGNQERKVYSYVEATKEGVGGVVLSDADYVAYMSTRRLFDHTWTMENKMLRDEMILKGRKVYDDESGVRSVVSEYDTPLAARGSYNASRFKQIKTEDGIVEGLDGLDLEKKYTQGYRLVEAEDYFEVGPNKVKYSLVRKDAVGPVEGKVLDYIPGYVPVVRQNANYFVKQNTKEIIDGVKQSGVPKTIRYFDNQQDAQEFVQREMKRTGNDKSEYNVVFDREQTPDQLRQEMITSMGGLYKGRRASEAPKFGLEGVEGAQLSPMEALQGYMNSISKRMPISAYRQGLKRKWMNSARETIDFPRDVSWNDVPDQLEKMRKQGVNPKRIEKLRAAHEQIDHISMVSTTGEDTVHGFARGLGDRLSKLGTPKSLVNAVYNWRGKDPAGMLRAATHHMLLGMGNPAQIVVQASALTSAVSIHPVAALRGLPHYFALTALDWAPERLRKAMIKNMKSKQAMGKELSDLEEVWEAWRRSGQRESAMQASADFSAIAAGQGFDTSVVGRMWGKIKSGANKSAFLYRAGETIARRMAFTTAFYAQKKVAGESAEELSRRVSAYADQLTYSMSASNKAGFQKGWMSVPTQFMQVFSKFTEAFVGDKFTKAQKVQLALGQMGLFGAAGIPVGGWLLETFIPEKTAADMSEEQKILFTRGAVGWWVNSYLGIDALVTGRMAIGQDAFDTLYNALTEEHSFIDGLLGPSGVVKDRVLTAFRSLGKVGRLFADGDAVPNHMLTSSLNILAQDVAGIATSGKNALEGAQLLNRHILSQTTLLRDKNGRKLWEDPEVPELKDAVARILGFTSQDVSDVYDYVVNESESKQVKREAIGRGTKYLIRMVDASGDENQAEAYTYTLNMILNSFDNPQDREEVRQGIINNLNSKTRRDDMAAALSSIESEFSAATNNFNPLLERLSEEAK